MRFVLLLLVASLMGCSSGETRLPVAGKVMWHGRPLTSGAVILRPDAAKGNTSKHEPRGTIDPEGSYQVATAGQAGAPPGWYKVGVVATEPGDPNNPYAIRKSLIPAKYGDPEQSELSLQVVPAPTPAAYDITLKAE
jgi:hypothetical protein